MRVITLLLVLVSNGCDRSEPLYFDTQGAAHGTGEEIYRYDSGEIMLREQYIDGKLELSRWYMPDGTLIQETDWINQAGEGIYLRQDGSIRSRMNYNEDGFAEGPATYYDATGAVTKVVIYRDGQPVDEVESAKPGAR